MPYIKEEDRIIFDKDIDNLIEKVIKYENNKKSGMLNYIISRIISGSMFNEQLNYDKINTCIGILESAKIELYSRLATPYEKDKILENGDIKEYKDIR